MLWYQFVPYHPYFKTGRYQEVVALANSAVSQATDLEESYYWHGKARAALGLI